MPEIQITTQRGKVQTKVKGSTSYCKGETSKDLGLDRSTMAAAARKLDRGRFGDFRGTMFVGHTVSIEADDDDISVDESSKIIAVANDVLRNRSSVTGTYTSSLSHTVTHSMNVTWSSCSQMSRGFKIEGGLYLTGSGSLDFTTTTGKQVSKSMSETVGSQRQLSVTLRPGEQTKAILTLKKRHIKVYVPFKIRISGHLAIEYEDSSPITHNLKDVLRAVGKPYEYKTTAIVDITCFTDADVSMYDPDD